MEEKRRARRSQHGRGGFFQAQMNNFCFCFINRKNHEAEAKLACLRNKCNLRNILGGPAEAARRLLARLEFLEGADVPGLLACA